jgi:hypothetical protein
MEGMDAMGLTSWRSVPVLARVSGSALFAAFLILGCAGCAATAKPATTPRGNIGAELLATFTAFRRDGANTPAYAAIPPSAVAGITPGTLHDYHDLSTGTYWAVADFSVTEAASKTAAAVGFQDGGNDAVFMQAAGRSWRIKSVGPCMAGLPSSVAAALELTASPNPLCPHGIPAP